ncbi:MAG: hypothetical protein ACYCYO_15090 [Bacilli bacterium]
MQIVRTEQDLEALKESRALPTPLFDAIAAYFHDLREASGIETPGQPFVLDSGYIAVIDPSDTETTLSDMLQSWPEYAERIELDGHAILKLVVMEDNDFIATYFLEEGISPIAQAFMAPYVET